MQKKELVCTRLRPKQIQQLKEIAEKKEMNISELLRLIVDKYLEMV